MSIHKSDLSFSKKLRMCGTVHNDYYSVENEYDLRKRGLSLADYRVVPCVLESLYDKKLGYGLTFNQKVADYFKKFGFHVELGSDGVNYVITFP